MWVHSDFFLSKFLWFRPWSVLLGSDAVRWSVRSARWIGTGDLWKRDHGQAAVSENRSYIYIMYHCILSEKFKAACWNKSLLTNLYMVVSSIHSCHSKAFGKTTLNRIEADLWTTCMMFFPVCAHSCVEHVFFAIHLHTSVWFWWNISAAHRQGLKGPPNQFPNMKGCFTL